MKDPWITPGHKVAGAPVTTVAVPDKGPDNPKDTQPHKVPLVIKVESTEGSCGPGATRATRWQEPLLTYRTMDLEHSLSPLAPNRTKNAVIKRPCNSARKDKLDQGQGPTHYGATMPTRDITKARRPQTTITNGTNGSSTKDRKKGDKPWDRTHSKAVQYKLMTFWANSANYERESNLGSRDIGTSGTLDQIGTLGI